MKLHQSIMPCYHVHKCESNALEARRGEKKEGVTVTDGSDNVGNLRPSSTATTAASSNDDTKRLIASMLSSDAVFDDQHYHSFKTVPFLFLPVHSCAGCGERVQPSVFGSTLRPLHCAACGCYAHRSCAFSTTLDWKEKCSVNHEKYGQKSHLQGQKEEEEKQQQQHICPCLEDDNEKCENQTSDWVRKEESIFRPSRDCSLLDTFESPPVISTKSEDGILDGSSNSRTGAPVDYIDSKANFPFLSSVQLLRGSHCTENWNFGRGEAAGVAQSLIRPSKTWTEGQALESESSECNKGFKLFPPSFCHLPSIKGKSSKMDGRDMTSMNLQEESAESLKQNPTESQCFLWTQSGPSPHWANDKLLNEIDLQSKELRHGQDSSAEEEGRLLGEDRGPLHFSSGFRAVSEALFENITATFGRIVSTESNHQSSAAGQENGDIVAPTAGVGKIDESVGDGNKQIRRLLEETQPMKIGDTTKKRLGIGYVAGSVAGGLAGLVLAGPAAGLVGMKIGQLGALGLLLEGSFTVGALAGGVAAGQNLGKHLDEKMQESRVLALGEGTQRRVLLLIRPSIQQPGVEWDNIYRSARQTYCCEKGFVSRLISNESHSAQRERYEREVDIVQVDEAELATTDKVLLLVSRILNNKNSLPGHIYRQLVEAIRRRAASDPLQSQTNTDSGKSQVENSFDTVRSSIHSEDKPKNNEARNEGQVSRPGTKMRQDTHAVIKYVTATLLETRPGFGSSDLITEMTAMAVESLVFGEVYDLVMSEIEFEKKSVDDDLSTKIACFEMSHGASRCDVSVNTISQKALDSLRRLPEAHSAVDKLRYCVSFLEGISNHFSDKSSHAISADLLLPIVCQHILASKARNLNAQVAFLEEFARDEQLLRGREGYALVTLQAALHYLNSNIDFDRDIFGPTRKQ